MQVFVPITSFILSRKQVILKNIKLIIFDLDGVLLDAKQLHREVLDDALAEIDTRYVITDEEQETFFEALPTKKKLQLLTELKGLPVSLHAKIAARKQELTIARLLKLERDERICEVLSKLKQDSFTLAVASNSVRASVKIALLKLGFMEFIDFWFSNQDVADPKPSPEMFLTCMIKAGVGPNETLILEDSEVGFKAVEASGAKLCPIKDSSDVSYEKIISCIKPSKAPIKSNKPLNVLIPMAGRGSRFEAAGYTFPKPLIDVKNKPMIQVVVENLNLPGAHFIFVIQKAHCERYNVKHLLNLIAPGCDIIETDGLTEGAACTTLLARGLIDNNIPLLLANSDQFVEWNSEEFLTNAEKVDGSILTFQSLHPRWSFVKLNDEGFVSEVAEKNPISNQATVGIYYFKKGSDYVRSADQMISKNIRTNGEFYVCPVFNEAIENGLKINTLQISSMFGTGTPEDLQYFLQNYHGKV